MFYIDIYKVKKLKESDIECIYNLCKDNKTYYKYYKQQPTFENIKEIFNALPNNVTIKDKFFVGFYKDEKLIAILDLIRNFPKENNAYIGLFMIDKSMQNKGIGSQIIEKVFDLLKLQGINYIELAYIKENIEAKNFWLKNKFLYKNKITKLDNLTVVSMYREI